MIDQLWAKSKVIFPLIRASVPLETDPNRGVYQNWLSSLDRLEQLEIIRLSATLMLVASPLQQVLLISAIHKSTPDDTSPLVRFLVKEQNKPICDFYIQHFAEFERLNDAYMIFAHQVFTPPKPPERTVSILAPKPMYPHQLETKEDESTEQQEENSSLPSFNLYVERFKQERGPKGGLRKSKSISMEELTGSCAGMSLEEAAQLFVERGDGSVEGHNTVQKFLN